MFIDIIIALAVLVFAGCFGFTFGVGLAEVFLSVRSSYRKMANHLTNQRKPVPTKL